jgi:succinyl-diaminopimelate desuccinylase
MSIDLPPERAELIELLRSLIRVDTVNPPGGERGAAEIAVEFARKNGLQAELVELEPGRANVEIQLPGRGEQAAILYCGHLDTVPLGNAPWTHPPHDGFLDETLIWGRGAVDMKGGVASMLMGLAELARQGTTLPGDVRFLGTIGEEVDCVGARAAAARGVMDGVGQLVIAEPTNLDVVVAHKGALFVRLTTRGRSAHGSMPEQGVSAIDHMTLVLDRLRGFDFAVERHALLGPPTLGVGTISGGSAVNLVPDHCTAELDIRTVPGVSHATVLRAIQSILDDLSREHGQFAATMSVFGDYAPVGTSVQDPLVIATSRVVESVRGRPARIAGVSYFSDASVLLQTTGVPTVLCGPGDPSLTHQTDERLELRQLSQAAAIFQRIPLEVFSLT